jgi:hypothetical protein
VHGARVPARFAPSGRTLPLIDERSQGRWGPHGHRSIADLDESALLQPLEHRAYGIALEIGGAGQFVLCQRNFDGNYILRTGVAASREPQERGRAAPVAVPEHEVGGDGDRDVGVYQQGLQKKTPTTGGSL